jgi:hypothetical protein
MSTQTRDYQLVVGGAWSESESGARMEGATRGPVSRSEPPRGHA